MVSHLISAQSAYKGVRRHYAYFITHTHTDAHTHTLSLSHTHIQYIIKTTITLIITADY